MNAPRASVTCCIIEPDALYGQTTFYDVKTEICDKSLVIQNIVL